LLKNLIYLSIITKNSLLSNQYAFFDVGEDENVQSMLNRFQTLYSVGKHPENYDTDKILRKNSKQGRSHVIILEHVNVWTTCHSKKVLI